MKVIFIALAMLILPAPVMAQETGMLVAQAGDNRPATRGDFYRLDGKMDRLDERVDQLGKRVDRLDQKIEETRRDLGGRIDALGARIDARIDGLITAIWAVFGVVVAAIVAGLLGIVAMLIPALLRREKGSGDSASLSPDAPASASR